LFFSSFAFRDVIEEKKKHFQWLTKADWRFHYFRIFFSEKREENSEKTFAVANEKLSSSAHIKLVDRVDAHRNDDGTGKKTSKTESSIKVIRGRN
jgi:hypothetical protein